MNPSTTPLSNTQPVDADSAGTPGYRARGQLSADRWRRDGRCGHRCRHRYCGGRTSRCFGRYVARHGESRLRSVVFAAAVPPYLMKTVGNPKGPLTAEKAQQTRHALEVDRNTFFDQFTQNFFSASGVLQVTESQRSEAVAICQQSAQHAALACMDAFSTTDFREDLKKLTVPTLVIHGDADAIVPFEGSGLRTHFAVPHSQLVRVGGAPHGLNVSHAKVFNEALLSFLRSRP
jgi:non-heme chloroperoxidase